MHSTMIMTTAHDLRPRYVTMPVAHLPCVYQTHDDTENLTVCPDIEGPQYAYQHV